MLSIDCLLKHYDIQTNPAFAKIIMALQFPLFCFAFALVFWTIYGLIKMNRNWWRYLIQSICIIIYFFLPSLVASCLPIFNCINPFNNGKTYMLVDLNIVCWDTDHSYYLFRIAIPAIVIWAVLAPLIAYIFIFK